MDDYNELVKQINAVTLEKSYLLEARDGWLKEWRQQGKSLRAIGELSGLSFARVKQILDAAQ